MEIVKLFIAISHPKHAFIELCQNRPIVLCLYREHQILFSYQIQTGGKH